MQRTAIELPEWQFQIDQNDRGERQEWFQQAYDKSGWMSVQAPGPWDFYQEAFWGYEGVGWYAAEISGELAEPHSLQWIVFNSVSGHARVWLNGIYLGEHLGPYLPFEFVVSPYLRTDGSNQIVIKVDNVHREEWLPGGRVVEWIQYGGILQKVALETTSTVYVASLGIRTSLTETGAALVHCNAEVMNGSNDAFEGELTIQIKGAGLDSNQPVHVNCLPNKAVIVSWECGLADPQLWELHSPHLYSLQAMLSADGTSLDELEARFGIRTVETAGNTILLNGKPLIIKGVNRNNE
ncbi:hypothetical protein K0U00_35300, partial [Paenibacillus sepulcri]|nr:hypothetical protein [Paenibacillus sepulcri]